ncbi:MAG: hypothetical protein MJY59_04810, partial [Bacteroidaceae bacterium]|nr:hypothetical protein [Bacteroidaceae bacterium]
FYEFHAIGAPSRCADIAHPRRRHRSPTSPTTLTHIGENAHPRRRERSPTPRHALSQASLTAVTDVVNHSHRPWKSVAAD